ncbi:LuxR C-terminal-related transcriptional regulator [Arthrobacter sp. ISL-28]|uniref:LuxR C-terminal-related transcriptional regulator n=1 Tax=Arthrobacter sp. ISL-28 TaxID=2819108 RepID=UPI0037C19B39
MLLVDGLSPREREVCHEVIAGHAATHIATHLSVTPNTVQDHVNRCFPRWACAAEGNWPLGCSPTPSHQTTPDNALPRAAAVPSHHATGMTGRHRPAVRLRLIYGREATPGGRNRLPLTRSDAPTRSR